MRSFLKVVVCCLAVHAWGDASAQPDLNVDVLNAPISPTYTGTPDEWGISVTNIGDSAALFAPGETVLRVSLPDFIKVDGARFTISSGTTGNSVCTVAGQTVTCDATEQLEMEAGGSQTFFVFFELLEAGNFDLLASGASCVADPDGVLAEVSTANNDCTSALGSIVARALPGDLNVDWLQVNQWSSLVRRYNSATNTVSRSEIGLGPGDEPLHALNEIVRHPQTGDLYVFQRPYQTTEFGLGIYTPGGGVAPIGDTGLSLYDAAFDGDGTLFVLGRDGKLYTLDTATAAPTQRCVTEFSSAEIGAGNAKQGALAWDSNEGLVAVGDDKLVFIDTLAFPLDPEDDCVSQIVDISLSLDNIFSAEVVNNRLYVMNRSSRLVYIAWDGVGGLLALAPHDAHGLIAFDDDLPAPAVACPADVYVAVTMPFFTTSTSLYGVDLATGTLGFIREMPIIDMQGMELDPRTGDLLVTDLAGTSSLFRISPCDAGDPGELLSSPGAQSLFALDLARDETLRTVNDATSLEQLDRVSGLATKLGDLQKSSDALAVYNREAIVADWVELAGPGTGPNFSTGLAFYDLANVAGGPVRTVPLSFGGGLEAGQIRKIESLDSGPEGEPLIGILARTQRSSSSRTSEARPNALVTISLEGVVQHLADFPVSAIHIATAYPGTAFKDGFEEQ